MMTQSVEKKRHAFVQRWILKELRQAMKPMTALDLIERVARKRCPYGYSRLAFAEVQTAMVQLLASRQIRVGPGLKLQIT